jgi:tryptophan synthase alpha chain
MGKLGIYLVANYPSKKTFLQAVEACEIAGIDFLEVGFPFSDPVADGDLLEKAAQAALKTNTSDDFAGSFREARTIFTGRTYIMTYTNIIFRPGISRFLKKTGPVDGVILADLPLRGIPLIEKRFGRSAVNIIRFLTPESRPEDVTLALEKAKDFVYFVSKRGTTGGVFDLDRETVRKITDVRGRGTDVYVGFGIQGREDVTTAYSVADGAIIGTKAVAELEQGVDQFKRFLGSLKS